MTTENTTTAPKKLTITLTNRPPVKITEEQWPLLAAGSWSDHDGQVECQANRRWKAWIKVRQHEDGRTIVYGLYDYDTAFQGEPNANYRDGQMVTPSAEDYPEGARESFWVGQPIIDAIRAVGERLQERSGHECWPDLIATTIADMPAEELA